MIAACTSHQVSHKTKFPDLHVNDLDPKMGVTLNYMYWSKFVSTVRFIKFQK